METENLKKFIDSIVDGAYKAGIFQKEAVHEILMITEVVKNKLSEVDTLQNENTELKAKVAILELENNEFKKRFEDLDSALEDSKPFPDLSAENIINEIDVKEV